MVWLITFRCHGTRLHAPPPLENWERRAMIEQQYSLDGPRRALTMRAVREVCAVDGCGLLAAHVRTTHLHLIVDLDRRMIGPAGLALNIKRQASRLLNAEGLDVGRLRRWARGGDYQRVVSVGKAIRYVVERQGAPMELYLHPDWLTRWTGGLMSEA